MAFLGGDEDKLISVNLIVSTAEPCHRSFIRTWGFKCSLVSSTIKI